MSSTHQTDHISAPEVGKTSSPVSGYTAGIDVEVSITPVRLHQDWGDASVSAVDVTSGREEVNF